MARHDDRIFGEHAEKLYQRRQCSVQFPIQEPRQRRSARYDRVAGIEDFFVRQPDEKVLYTGNPIISGGPSLPWLLDGKLDAALATLIKLLGMLPKEIGRASCRERV